MSTERDILSGMNDENMINLDCFYPSGCLSPSSWDDSNEEQSDEDSSASVGQEKLANEKIIIGDLFHVDSHIKDRRQSLARMRRRTRSGSSLVMDNVIGKNSSESCGESDGYSPERNNRKYEEVMSPDLLPVSQNGNDSNSCELISEVENNPDGESFYPTGSKLVGKESKISKCVIVVNGRRGNKSETSEDDIEFHCDSKLSKIVEEEESWNMSLGSSKTRSAVPLCFQVDNTEYTTDNHFSCNESRPMPEMSETLADEKTVPVEYISKEILVSTTDEEDSDDSDLWRKIRSKVGRKNSEYVMNYEDSQYISRSLKLIFDEKTQRNASADEEDGFDVNDKNVKRVTLKKGNIKNEASADEIRNCEIPHFGVAESSERTLNNASSKETVDLGLENLFCVEIVPENCSAVSYAADDNVKGKDVRGSTPRSGRETFLIRECSMAWKLPSNRYGTRRVRSNHTISLSTQDKLTDFIKYTDKNLHFDDDRDRYSLEEVNTDTEISITRESRYAQSTPRKMTDFCFNATGNRLIDNSNMMQNTGNDHVNENDINQSNPTSFRSKILLDLDLSDNEEKCSTMERIIFSDYPEYVNKSFTPRNKKIMTCSPKNSAAIEQKTTEIGKSEMKESLEIENRNIYIPPHNYDQFEIGDSKWNHCENVQSRFQRNYIYVTEGELWSTKISLPQDRGDITYEKPDTKPGWGTLITSLECRSPEGSKKSLETVFGIDLHEDPLGDIKELRQTENSRNYSGLRPKWECGLRKPKISLQESDNWKPNESLSKSKKTHLCTMQNQSYRIKAKKRKRVNFFLSEKTERQRLNETESHYRWGDRLFDRRGNWLVNTVTRRKDILTRGKQWIQKLILTRKRDKRIGAYQHKWEFNNRPIPNTRNKFTDCFAIIFKQIVNIFTISRKNKK